jgi:rhodanese-related sulfurtransferase
MAGVATGAKRMTARRGIHRALAVAAVVLAALAALGGDASPPVSSRDGAEVTALELARWIREGRPNLHVIDLRTVEEFESFAIPGAERMSASELVGRSWEDDATVVVYGDSGPPPREVGEGLRARGVESAFVLGGGMSEWVATIAAPVLPANPSREETDLSREIAEMSRWFGGVPRVSDATSRPRDSVREAMGRIRRRGC